ncbi:hypothetical protein Patl_0684 [Paraglaciecola sp. T6c]|uniref:hypothetical protein n=1 Tax=Pseudoalteromonas atlantica (strain T6c / ATCC BAA-1087) TaxID=3042615 RepID=UPI00005C56DB|nr:hypothetical protein [Paraglaciecola sp. T6c]ABG39212.1 hypothetical protein Patl_0684 [Paraglaciecola sp. T6c]
MCIRSKIHLAIVDQCNQAILFHKRRPTINSQIMAEEVLTTCSGITDHAGFIDLNALIQKALINLENGTPQIIPVGGIEQAEKPVAKKADLDNEGFGINCPGCQDEISPLTAGGYRSFCTKCVAVFPPIPNNQAHEGGYFIDGEYPNFTWIEAGVTQQEKATLAEGCSHE